MRERLAQLRDDLRAVRETLHLQPDRVRARRRRRRSRSLGSRRSSPRRRAGRLRRPGADGQLDSSDDRPRASGTTGRAAARSPSTTSLARGPHRRRARAPRATRSSDLSLALLRAEVWGTGSHLHRVTAPLRGPQRSTGRRAVAHGRLVITGATGHRLHEELIAAGCVRLGSAGERLGVEADRRRRSRTADGQRRPEDAALTSSSRACTRARDQLRAALEARAGDRARQLTTTLAAPRRARSRSTSRRRSPSWRQTIRREAFGEQGDAAPAHHRPGARRRRPSSRSSATSRRSRRASTRSPARSRPSRRRSPAATPIRRIVSSRPP